MKKYDVPLALATSGGTEKIAYARMLFDLLQTSELNDPLRYEGSFADLKQEPFDKLLALLDISFDERAECLKNPDQIMNYDVAIALASAENIEHARKVVQHVNVKKCIDPGDFLGIDAKIWENEADVWKTLDLHTRLYQWLRNNNLPQPEIPSEDKFYIREVAVKWNRSGMAEYLEKDSINAGRLFSLNYKKKGDAAVRFRLFTFIEIRSSLQKMLAAIYGFGASNSLKFIDYVCIAGNEVVWLIEGKRKLNPESIDQILEYHRLFQEDYPNVPVRVAIVCEETNPAHEQTCQENGIEVFHMR